VDGCPVAARLAYNRLFMDGLPLPIELIYLSVIQVYANRLETLRFINAIIILLIFAVTIIAGGIKPEK
jgi:hypothetical protein